MTRVRRWTMETATATQKVIHTPSTYWAKTKTLSRSWAFFLFSGRPQWHQDKGTIKHRQSPQAGYVPHPPAGILHDLEHFCHREYGPLARGFDARIVGGTLVIPYLGLGRCETCDDAECLCTREIG